MKTVMNVFTLDASKKDEVKWIDSLRTSRAVSNSRYRPLGMFSSILVFIGENRRGAIA